MAQIQKLAFNRGRISKYALARLDVDRYPLSAEIQTNWIPRTFGSMMLRPGFGYIDSTLNNATAIHIPFIFSNSDTAILELTDSVLRVRVNEAIISRVAVSTTVANGTFNSTLTSWADADEAGGVSQWATGGYMSLMGTGFNAAIRTQTVSVSGGDQNKEHALRIIVSRGTTKLRVGSSDGDDDYIAETELGTGTHSLAFTPTGGSVYIKLFSYTESASLIDSCVIESAGEMHIPTPWALANLPYLRWDESADIIYVACSGLQQRKIERRSTRSWSVVLYAPLDGPFGIENISSTLLTASDISGDITITSSAAIFKATQVGALFRLGSVGQLVEAALSGEEQYSDPIRVTGSTDAQRRFYLTIAGTWVGTVTVQKSIGDIGGWVTNNTYTGNTTNEAFDDRLYNEIAYYRVGIVTGDYTSGEADITLSFSSGSISGIAKITDFDSSTSVSASVLTHLGGTTATNTWSEGAWSDYRGWPSAVTLDQGRLWWAGKGNIWGSVSDAYESFDDTTLGDSAPISRTIGSGPVDTINWLLPLLRIIVGTDGREITARSSSLDEPLTVTNFNLKTFSNQGSRAGVPAAVVDNRGIFVQKGGVRLFQMDYSPYSSADYESADLTEFCPEIGLPGITRIAVQRQPDTRIHCLRSDGTVGLLISEPLEKMSAWVDVTTSGTVEDIFVMPGDVEDKVYYLVNRTINGVTKRYLERWALESECRGAAICKLADSFTLYNGVATNTITGLSHLEAASVVAWGDGKALGTFTVTSGQIILPASYAQVVVGMPYTATYKSTKLNFQGKNLGAKKNVDHTALILADTHAQGIQYGVDLSYMDDLPLVENGAVVDPDYIWGAYDENPLEVNGSWGTDQRICLTASAPKPATILGLNLYMN